MDDKTYDDLVLMLLYVRSWKSHEGSDHSSSWKGFDFESLNRLEDRSYIGGKHRNKSVILGPEGISKAKELLRQYGFE